MFKQLIVISRSIGNDGHLDVLVDDTKAEGINLDEVMGVVAASLFGADRHRYLRDIPKSAVGLTPLEPIKEVADVFPPLEETE